MGDPLSIALRVLYGSALGSFGGVVGIWSLRALGLGFQGDLNRFYRVLHGVFWAVEGFRVLRA